jgi:flagellar hook assembly protein FlgD
VTLRIYDVAGRLIKTLVDDNRLPGIVHKLAWDGKNDAGGEVASGVYFYKLVAGDFSQTNKMVLLK